MPRNLILAFLIAAPFGGVFGFAATTLLSPHVAAGAFNLFLGLIVLGALGLVVAFRPVRAAARPTTLLPA